MTSSKITLQAFVPESLHDKRLDKAMSVLFSDYSRSQHQQWIERGVVRVNDIVIAKSRHKVSQKELIEVITEQEDLSTWQAQDLPIQVVHEDDDLLIINKAAHCIVHPGAGVEQGTLANALLYYCPQLANIPRAGLIHRLDKNTTGLLVVAKTSSTYQRLSHMMAERTIHRQYHALVHGDMISGGRCETAYGRHPQNRKKMAVLSTGKRHAITHYRVTTRYHGCTYLTLELETGRTHQIRVHMQHLRHPIIGDQTYGRMHAAKQLPEVLHAMQRQCLHAAKLSFEHPTTQQPCSWEAPLPDDFAAILTALEPLKQ